MGKRQEAALETKRKLLLAAEKLISGVRDVRELEKKLANWTPAQFEENRLKTIEGTNKVVEIIRAKKEGK